eukprot:TRINITY_DN6645_c1_g1_i1.p1 TRINITY_DN6645_c1_g1~~TRINITY_DN6645_c1_g1_i1.p1  ORF type:complete len:815 (+),score=291.53 TRINITY_DN6645_c1_g1_i1:307-2445(+)
MSGAVPRLGVPDYDWGMNCQHGVETSCVHDPAANATYCPTSFPNSVNLGATWDKTLWKGMAGAIALEARAMWRAGAREHKVWTGRPKIGLDCWSPNINMNRDPRWGRNSEVPSEDPTLNGEYGSIITKGVQESPLDDRYMNAVSTLKHFAAYSLERSDGFSRGDFDAKVSHYALSASYLPAFAHAVKKGQAKGIMCAYNAVNGVPACVSKHLLVEALRDAWGFDGYVTSDTAALTYVWRKHNHHYVHTENEAACAALEAKCDIASDFVYHDSLLRATDEGLCDWALVESALKNTLTRRFELGLFDPVEAQPLWHVPLSVVESAEHVELARQIARESMVLLKNDASQQRALPFAKGQRVGVLGPLGNAAFSMIGNYYGQACPEGNASFGCIETPAQAVRRYAADTVVVAGCGVKEMYDKSGFDAALAAVDEVDAAVLMFGDDITIEVEHHDRNATTLYGVQRELLALLLAKLASQGKPAVVVLMNGGAVSLGADAIAAAPAILDAFFPGKFGALPIAETIFGENAHLGGKMPYTVYPAEYVDAIKMSNMEYDDPATPGRTYRYYTGKAEFRFGEGYSLTTFEVAAAGVRGGVACDQAASAVSFDVTVTNTGARAGDTVLQVYAAPSGMAAPHGLPVRRQLLAWERVHLLPGASATLPFTLSRDSFAEVGADGDRHCHPAPRELIISDGGHAADVTLRVDVAGERTKTAAYPDV